MSLRCWTIQNTPRKRCWSCFVIDLNAIFMRCIKVTITGQTKSAVRLSNCIVGLRQNNCVNYKIFHYKLSTTPLVAYKKKASKDSWENYNNFENVNLTLVSKALGI